MKIALVCSSLGYSQRGMERFSSELFETVKDEIPITLFGCRLPKASNQVSLPCIKFDHPRLKHFMGKTRDNYYIQQLSYFFTFLPRIVLEKYDLIHYNEPAIGHFLFHARNLFKFKYRILFTDALGFDPVIDPGFFKRPDLIQTITTPHYKRLLRSGVPKNKIKNIPYGIDPEPYLVRPDKIRLRKKYGIPENKIVVL